MNHPPFSVLSGDSLTVLSDLPADHFQCCVTSPPYWQLRNYSSDKELGQETDPHAFVDNLVAVFRGVKRVLKTDGVLWVNMGDTYAGGGGYSPFSPSNQKGSKQSTNRGAKPKARPVPKGCKQKDLVGIPWMLAFALRSDGWYLRSEVIWNKPNCFPERVTDRPTRSHEHVFMLSKSKRYYYDQQAGSEAVTDGEGRRNRRSVWSINKSSYSGAHFAVFPEELAATCLLPCTRPGDLVLDPFCGSGTTGVVSVGNGRGFVGIDLNPQYAALATDRIARSLDPDFRG